MSKLTDQQKIDAVIGYCAGQSMSSLARRYGITTTGMRYILVRRGVVLRTDMSAMRRQYQLVEDYFVTIDTERKAYWLGLWYADGCVTLNKRDTYACTLSLTEEDGYLVEAFRDEVFPNGDRPVYRRAGYHEARKGRKAFDVQPSVAITIYSRRFAEALQRNGCLRRKTVTLQFPTEEQVPAHLLPHFVRGFFDGDGCISKPRRGLGVVDFISTDGFIQGLRRALRGVLGVDGRVYRRPTSTSLTYGSRATMERAYQYFYPADASVWMRRKRERFETALGLCP